VIAVLLKGVSCSARRVLARSIWLRAHPAMFPVVLTQGPQAEASQGSQPASGTQVPPPPDTQVTLALPAEIRIGPKRHGYMYELHFPSGVYRCCRHSDWGADKDVLFLFKDPAYGP